MTNPMDDQSPATKGDLNQLGQDLRVEMKEMETGIRKDMKKMETGIRHDMKEMEGSLRSEIVDLRTEMGDLRTEMRDGKRHMQVLHEDVMAKLDLIIEGRIPVVEKLDDHENRLTQLEAEIPPLRDAVTKIH